MTWLRRLDRWWMTPLDPRPLAFFRIVVGVFGLAYLIYWWPSMASNTDLDRINFAPIGVATILNEPLAGWIVQGLLTGALVTGIAFTLGWCYRFTGPAFALLLLWDFTYRNSWGQIFHTENLLILHVIVLAIVPAADALSLDARRQAHATLDRLNYGWPLRLCALITVITYVIAGWAKIDISGLDWITSDALRNHVARDNVRKELLAGYYSSLGAWLVGHGWIFKPMAVATIVVELFAPLALIGRRIALVWVAGAWLFHMAILTTMMIPFIYPLLGIAFLPLFAWDGRQVTDTVRRLTAMLRPRLRLPAHRRPT